jgi:hypothetical protein
MDVLSILVICVVSTVAGVVNTVVGWVRGAR